MVLAVGGCDDVGVNGSFGPAIASGASAGSTGDADGGSPPPTGPDADTDDGDASTTGEPIVGGTQASTGGADTTGTSDVGSTTGDDDATDGSGDASTGGEPPPPPPPPPPDPCVNGMFGDGPYCGESIGGTPETLYVCAGGVTTGSIACDFGCAQCDPFEADVCMAQLGQTDAEACR